MIAALTDRMERERHRRRMEWIGSSKKTARKRKELLGRIAYNPDPVPLQAKLLREETFEKFIRRTYRLQINPDDQTEAILALPKDASVRHRVPALIGIHEHGGQFLLGKDKLLDNPKLPPVFRAYQERCYGGQPPGDYFAANGFAVFTIDQLGFGSRAIWHEEDKPYRRGEKPFTARVELKIRLRMRYEQFRLHRALLTHGTSEAELSLYDNRRSIDFIETIPEIDSSRIGAFGLSVGSMQTYHLAAFDQRVKAAVPVCWSGDYGEMLKRDGPRVLGVHFLLPHINAECHVAEFVALTEPRAVLIINGTKDSMYTLKNQKRTRAEILRIAKRQGREKTVRWHFFNGPHCFRPCEQRLALQFFREFLAE